MAVFEVAFERFAQDPIPSSQRIQLSRSLWEPAIHAYACSLVLLPLRADDGQRHLFSVLCLSRSRLQQQWTAGDSLGSVIEASRTHEQTPLVVDRRDTACQEPATLQIARGKPPQTTREVTHSIRSKRNMARTIARANLLHIAFRLAEGRFPPAQQQGPRVKFTKDLNQACDNPCPPGLMARTNPGSVVAVKVLVE